MAKVPKAIPLPGEKVDRATGLWFQNTGSDRFLRSPLIGFRTQHGTGPEDPDRRALCSRPSDSVSQIVDSD